MKKILLIIIISFFVITAKAQNSTIQSFKINDTTIFMSVEVMPKFPGNFQQFLIDHSLKNTGDKGIVYVNYIVEKDGSLSHLKVLRGLSEKANNEALRVMQESPKWSIGTQNGTPVRVRLLSLIHFN